jgi:hypothetical protein
MGETKRAGGAAGRFDAVNLKRTKSLHTDHRDVPDFIPVS